eukprot:15524-Pelagomonas_calceolata.AAC.1
MAIGEHVIPGHEVLSHIDKMNETRLNRNLQRHNSLNRFYSPGMGNVNIMILNHYLSKIPWNRDKNYVLQYHSRTDLAAGEITKELVEGILLTAAYKDAVILTTFTNLGIPLQGHAVTLKRSSGNSSHNNNTWFLLDSHNDHPKELLNSSDWNSLQDSIMFLQQGCVWDGLNPE